MIPKNAIKKVKNEIHLEIAAGSLISYGVFPQTSEGIQKAKETAASKDTWLAPSDLPEYYDGIDSDLMVGKENDAIRAIRKTLKQFYGISSAGTEGFVDTSSSKPATPPGLLDPRYPWQPVHQVGPAVWLRLKGKLTGRKIPELGNQQFTSYVKLSDDDANQLIENIKKSGYYPQMDRTDKSAGAYIEEDYQNWLVDTYLPNYGKTQVYKPGDKFVDDGKEFIDEILDNAEKALEEKSNEIMDAIDAVIAADTKKYEDFKKQLERKVDHPELYEELQHIQPRYMWGQNGLYDLNFKSDIDRAIYFAGKLGNKDTPDKVAVRGWLLEVTGLDFNADYKKIKEYRDRILALILQLVKLHPQEREVTVPPVYDGYYQDPPDEEEGEEVDDEEYDDLYGSNLDDLLEVVRSPKSPEEETDQELNEQVDDATQVLDEAEQAQQEAIDESVLEDLPEDLQQTLVDFINKRRNQKPDKEKTSSSNISNRKIYNFLTTNLVKIQDQLEGINQGIQNQNTLIAANVSATFSIIEKIESQDEILASKLDSLAESINKQSQFIKDQQDKQEDILAEQRAESQRDAAGTAGFTDLSGKGGGLFGNLLRFFGKRLASFIWRLLPRRLRASARLGRMVAKRLGPKIAGKVAAKIAAKKLAAKQIGSKITGKVAPSIAGSMASKPAAGAAEKLTKGSGQNVLQRALRSPAIQKALVNKIGKEGAEKLTLKIAAKAIPAVATAYGLGEGIARIAMGDVKGGFLSFGSAIPIAGWGFAAIDILRDIDTNAYTKHIEPNLPSPSGENFGAFFNDALGVSADQYERGGVTKAGIATLHGTEAVLPVNNTQPVDPIGGILVAATSQYINKVGPAAAVIAPTYEQIANPLAKVYDIPNTLVQTNVGGNFPTIENAFKRINQAGKTKRDEDEYSGKEKELIDTDNEDSFAEKLKKFIDPEGNFEKTVTTINQPNPDANPVNGDGLMAEGGYAVESGDIYSAYGWRDGKMHYGIDLSSARFTQGTPISVIKPGKVVFAGWQDPNNKQKGWGQFVVIEHDDKTFSLYGHLDSINVSQGQRIEPSADGKFPVIGKLGNTGRSTGAHLHFEVGTGWTGGMLKGHINPAGVVSQYLRGGGNVKAVQRPDAPSVPPPPAGALPTARGLGRQGAVRNKNFGATSGVGTKGYLIVPGHSSGGGAPEEKRLVKQLAKNTYNNLKSKFPDANIHYSDPDSMFEDTDDGWEKQKNWYAQKEKEGWEVLEVHMDASMESGQGSGRGVIAPTKELNPVESYFANNYGAFPRGHRDLAAPNRGVGLFELGNMSPELQEASKKNKVTKQQLDALTAPLERSIQSALNLKTVSPPKQQVRTLNMPGTDTSKQHLVVVSPSKPSVPGINAEFVSMGNNQWKTVREYDNSALRIIMTKLRQ